MLSVVDTRGADEPPSNFNAADYVLLGADAPEDKIALSVLSLSGAERWSYGRLRLATRTFAARLQAAGLGPGDTLLLRLGHSPHFPISFLAAVWSGILPVPTSSLLTDDEITTIAEALDPSAILTDGTSPTPRHPARCLEIDELEALPDDGNLPDPLHGSPDRAAYILCTSGTSGRPRLITHAHRAIWARRSMHKGWTGLTASDRLLHAGAFNWSYTLGTGLFDPWSVGATALVLSDETDISALPLLAKRHDATIIAAVPGIYRRMLRAPMPKMPKLRHALSAGEKMPHSLRARWRETMGTDIHEAFGQTECSTFISGSPDRPAPENTLGYAQPGRAIAITQGQHPVPRGDVGEISVSRDDPGLALGLAAHSDEWVPTGDLGEMAEDGAVLYHGRKDDILTAGGYRVSPVEIENAFAVYPGIDVAAAVDHELTADTIVVALYYTGAERLPEDSLKAHGEAHLAPYKVPRLFIHIDEMPTGKNGKLLRRALRTGKDSLS